MLVNTPPVMCGRCKLGIRHAEDLPIREPVREEPTREEEQDNGRPHEN
jgi:hypothetical protein